MDLTKIPISEAELKEQMPTLAINPAFIAKVYDGEYLNLASIINILINDMSILWNSTKNLPSMMDHILESQIKEKELAEGLLKSNEKLIHMLEDFHANRITL